MPPLTHRAARLARPLLRRTLIAAPRPGSGPLLSRRSDRALPDLPTPGRHWTRTLPVFGAVMAVSLLAIFNYQKSSSPVVSSNLYALRTSARAREALGDEIYFASAVPWIRGSIDQVHGNIDVSFWVKGTRGRGRVVFRSVRRGRMGYFDTIEWSLQPDGEEKISLLPENGQDPFQPAEAAGARE